MNETERSAASVPAWRIEPYEDEWWLYHTSGQSLIADTYAKAASLADHLNRTGWTPPGAPKGGESATHLGTCGDVKYEARHDPDRPPAPPSPVCRLDAGHEGRHEGRTMHRTVTWRSWPALNGPSVSQFGKSREALADEYPILDDIGGPQ